MTTPTNSDAIQAKEINSLMRPDYRNSVITVAVKYLQDPCHKAKLDPAIRHRLDVDGYRKFPERAPASKLVPAANKAFKKHGDVTVAFLSLWVKAQKDLANAMITFLDQTGLPLKNPGKLATYFSGVHTSKEMTIHVEEFLQAYPKYDEDDATLMYICLRWTFPQYEGDQEHELYSKSPHGPHKISDAQQFITVVKNWPSNPETIAVIDKLITQIHSVRDAMASELENRFLLDTLIANFRKNFSEEIDSHELRESNHWQGRHCPSYRIPAVEADIATLESKLGDYYVLCSNQPKVATQQRNWRLELDLLDHDISEVYRRLNESLVQGAPITPLEEMHATSPVSSGAEDTAESFLPVTDESQTTRLGEKGKGVSRDDTGGGNGAKHDPTECHDTIENAISDPTERSFLEELREPDEHRAVVVEVPQEPLVSNEERVHTIVLEEGLEHPLTAHVNGLPKAEAPAESSMTPRTSGSGPDTMNHEYQQHVTRDQALHGQHVLPPWSADQDSISIAAAILEYGLNEEPDVLTDLVWKLVEEDRIGLAYHLGTHLESRQCKTHIPTWLLESLAVGAQIQLPNHELATRSIVQLSKYSGSLYQLGLTEWNHAIRFLLVAAALRPAILASCNNCAVPLLEVHKKEGLESFFEYCQVVGEFAKKSRPLNPLVLLNESQRIEEQERISAEVEAWWQQAALTTVNYPSGTRVWKYWLEKGHLLDSLLFPIRSNDWKASQQLGMEVKRLSSDREIRKEISQTYQQVRTRSAIDHLQGKTINQLSQYLTKPLELCKRWLQLVEPSKSTGRSSSEKVTSKELYSAISRLTESAEQEIERFLTNHLTSLAIRAGGRACLRSIKTIFEVVCGQDKTVTSELPVYFILNHEFLKLTGLQLDGDWYPVSEKEDISFYILPLIGHGECSWEAAFEEHLAAKDHEATERILEYVRASHEGSVSVETMELRRRNHLEESQDFMKREVEEALNRIENAVAHGLLAEKDRLPYFGKVDSIRRSIPNMKTFEPPLRELRRIHAEIEGLHSRETEKVVKRLASAGIERESKNFHLIMNRVSDGDVLTANEYIDFLNNGQGIPVPEEREANFALFFPNRLNELDDYLASGSGGRRGSETVDARTIISKIRHRTGFPGVSLKKITGTQANEAADMMEAWFTLKRHRKISEPELRTLLMRLGFGLESILQKQIGRDLWIDLSTTVISDRRQVPVPFYGSDARGQYRILCLWDKQGAAEVARVVSDNYYGTPVIVFYFGRMTEGRRRDLAQISIEMRKTFIVVDEIVMLYVCGERGSRMRTLFEFALPFAFLEPFSTTAGLVSPEMFFGRTVELETIMNPKGACFLYGGRQLGKTALLRDAVRRFHDPEKGRIAIWLDLKEEGIGLDRTLNWIWSLITSSLAKFGVVPANLPSNTGPDKIFEKIELWLGRDTERRILLMLDEADRFLTSDAQEMSVNTREGFVRIGNLKGWMDKTERRFKVVFAGLHNVQRTTKQSNQPLAHFDDPVCIGPLLDNGEWREARSLIEQPFENMGFRFESSDLVTRILSRTNYYPNLIQLYCKHLLRQLTNPNVSNFDPRTSPPYVITSYHVDRAYSDDELYKSIRDRFMLTLNLDARYRVIAYAMALFDSPGEGLDVDRIRREVLLWWAKGFEKSASEDFFRVLLDEMVGLGVLRVCGPDSYALRSPNVISLMGSEEDIAKALEESAENEPPADYDAIYYRAALRTKTGVDPSKRSPLTAQQDSQLRSRCYGASLIFGTFAAGVLDVETFLNLEANSNFVSFAGTSDRTAFLDQLDKSLRAGNRRRGSGTIGFVPSTVPWSENWISEGLERLKKLRSQVSFYRLIFAADPRATWGFLRDSPGSLENFRRSGVTIFSLIPWGDLAVRQWLEDCGFAKNTPEGRQLIEAATGNWAVLLEKWYQACRVEPHRLEDHIADFDRLFDDHNFLMEVSDSLGLNVEMPRKVLLDLAILGQASAEDLIGVSQELDAVVIRAALQWAELLSLVKDIGGIYRVERVVARVLKRLYVGE